MVNLLDQVSNKNIAYSLRFVVWARNLSMKSRIETNDMINGISIYLLLLAVSIYYSIKNLCVAITCNLLNLQTLKAKCMHNFYEFYCKW